MGVDARTARLARILVRYCIEAKEGQSVDVGGSTPAEPLILCVYEELLRAGAFPVVRMAPPGTQEILFAAGRDIHFDSLPKWQRALARSVDASIRIRSDTNTRSLSGVNPSLQVRMSKTLKPIAEILTAKPWVLTLFPTEAYAQDAEMSLCEFEDFVYGATFADRDNPVAEWRKLRRRQDRLIAKLQGADLVRIVGPETDLSLSVKGRTFINSDGHHNMPSGEVFTGPVEESAEGTITYDFPICHAGREIDGVRLIFRDGRVVEASARKNEKFLLKMLDMDPGARRLGELGIGTNMGIQRFTRNILFDEKIGGTVHLAVGRSYPETGGRNRSALHWDMIKDLRRGGALYVDGKVLMKDGKFTP